MGWGNLRHTGRGGGHGTFLSVGAAETHSCILIKGCLVDLSKG